MNATAENLAAPKRPHKHKRSETFERHALVDRLFHWTMACCVLLLLATGVLPRMGLHFSWVTFHWIAGLTLTALVAYHVGRSLRSKKVSTIWFTRAELQAKQVGKYSVSQKLMHHGLGLVVLGSVCTGLVLLKKIRIPLLTRDPYVVSPGTWGWLHVLHDLAAMAAITLVMIHVYFALLPENRMYLRALINGRMSRADQRARVAAILNNGKPPSKSS